MKNRKWVIVCLVVLVVVVAGVIYNGQPEEMVRISNQVGFDSLSPWQLETYTEKEEAQKHLYLIYVNKDESNPCLIFENVNQERTIKFVEDIGEGKLEMANESETQVVFDVMPTTKMKDVLYKIRFKRKNIFGEIRTEDKYICLRIIPISSD